ncbi:MCP four helix bundle domain-containing protein [Methanospirillum sp. J.3.6.1-F.2.7.3]|uniref:MCP four helix bundle domain-containing protein n=1 Tax=Methanospirillum purgamenti TaxID=2834276 RepID=A0A8E7AZL4_9EURY|nr:MULTISPECIES: MCP four helix bundle domain-containing protein [Methanospirillum]MDX8551685.1 MCP four helix bundle domain-containing protein [Methanospirillum hungatei]QVV87677.1 MCP four helix bundle domain-containing protein [Methanospirillum sp. J.3.6.1-F.2.7.3]
MFLDNIQMKKKLIGGFLCIVILALIIAIIGYISMGDMAGKAQIMYDDNLVHLAT